jgi:8-oxo-dGTP pyrophosphatase MutT (NUDIX family)
MRPFRPIARVIIIDAGRIVLLERHRQGRHYFVFPGGGIDPGETPEQAAIREAHEETGLEVVLERLAAQTTFHGSPQYFFLARPVGGVLGSGDGPEFSQPPSEQSGTYAPCWVNLADLPHLTVLPASVAQLAAQYPSCPEQVMVFEEE